MHENEISKIILSLCINIHRVLGPGLLESVYERVLCYELEKAGLQYEDQFEVPIEYDGKLFKKAFTRSNCLPI